MRVGGELDAAEARLAAVEIRPRPQRAFRHPGERFDLSRCVSPRDGRGVVLHRLGTALDFLRHGRGLLGGAVQGRRDRRRERCLQSGRRPGAARAGADPHEPVARCGEPVRGKLLRRHTQHLEHGLDVGVEQHGAVHEHGLPLARREHGSDFPSAHFDVVREAMHGGNAEAGEAARDGPARALQPFGERPPAVRRAGTKNQAEAELLRVQVQGAAAARATHDVDAARPAVVHAQLAVERLVPTEACRRRAGMPPQHVPAAPRRAPLEARAIERRVARAALESRIDDRNARAGHADLACRRAAG